MNRRSFLRGAMALPVAAVAPVTVRPVVTATFSSVGPFRGEVFASRRDQVLKGFWEYGSDLTLELSHQDPGLSLSGDDDMSGQDARGPGDHDPSVPMTGHLPSEGTGEAEEKSGTECRAPGDADADATTRRKTTERNATIGADTTGARGGGPLQSEREGLHIP